MSVESGKSFSWANWSSCNFALAMLTLVWTSSLLNWLNYPNSRGEKLLEIELSIVSVMSSVSVDSEGVSA